MSVVPVGISCPCPGTPHPDGDTVQLRAKLGLHGGISVQRVIVETQQTGPDRLKAADLWGVLAEAYLLYGIESWSLVDAQGKPVPVTPESIREILLSDFTLSAKIAEKADDLYMGPVILPLVAGASSSSRSTPTASSTSPKRHGSHSHPKRSKRSSIESTPTDGIGTTSSSPDGAFSS